MNVEEKAMEFQEMLSQGKYSGKYDDMCVFIFSEYINQLRQQLEDIPEGCTVADAKKLREANHALAIENFELKKKLDAAMLSAAPKT